jgi:endonuclease G
MQVPQRIEAAARRRIEQARGEIENSVQQIRSGTPLLAEPETDRAVRRVAAVTHVDAETAKRIVKYEDPADLGLTGPDLRKAEAIQGKTVDYVGAPRLEAGRVASNAVARITFSNGQPQGTGFLVSDRLLLTNNHVIPDQATARDMVVEFGYELKPGQRAVSPVAFTLDPDQFFETDEEDDLDFTLVAIGAAVNGGSLAAFGACPLSGSAAKHSVGEPVNIVQHPDGDYKQVVVRENRILHRGDTVLHYLADTEPGASGSPVFNDEWQVVALHHWGGPHREIAANGRPLRTDVNEGIRVSAIVDELARRSENMPEGQRSLLTSALQSPPAGQFGTRNVHLDPDPGPQRIGRPVDGPRYSGGDADRHPRPIERPRAPLAEAGGAPASRIDREYSNRKGYNELFLKDFPVPLPQLSSAQRQLAARVSSAGGATSAHELKYQHFSVILNAARRMPFFSICNIDGAKRIRVDRDTGQATSGPEATETWGIDPRVPANAQLDDAFYKRLRTDLKIPSDFFARGHMTRREDPNWGVASAAERANDDTFHHTNACPQVQNAFNASQKVWQGIENFVLNSADDANLRVTVITGPVFRDDDPIYEDGTFGDIALPRRFWKVVARVEDGTPKVFAVLADQSEVMDLLIAAGREAREAFFDWPTKLSRELISTVEEIEALSGLDLGSLANFDVFRNGNEGLRPGQRILRPEQLFPDRSRFDTGGFGRFASMGEFLTAAESVHRRASPSRPYGAGAAPQNGPPPRARNIVEVQGRIKRVLSDETAGTNYQQFVAVLTSGSSDDRQTLSEIEACCQHGSDVRIAVRYGDSRGLVDRVPGLRADVAVRLRGEWIGAERSEELGGSRMPVIHFVHDPHGWLSVGDSYYN